MGKQNPYENGGFHVPLVIAGPGIKQGKSEALVYLLDLVSTFAEFSEAKLPEGVEGKSLRPILEGKLHFTQWDTNKEDSLRLEEFQVGQKNRKGLEGAFKGSDKNGDGKLSRVEYVDLRVNMRWTLISGQ